MRLFQRLVVGSAVAVAVMMPGIPAVASQTPTVVAGGSWHNSDPFSSWASCDLNRRSAAAEGYPTMPCEQHQVTKRWYFLIWW